MRCNRCHMTRQIRSGIKNGVAFRNLCDKCIGVLDSAVFSRHYERQYQRREYAKDIVQPSEKDFARLYGEDKARENGWTDEELRKFG